MSVGRGLANVSITNGAACNGVNMGGGECNVSARKICIRFYKRILCYTGGNARITRLAQR